MTRRLINGLLGGFSLLAFAVSPVLAAGIDGASDNARDDVGYYYIITGGKFPTGATPNGDNGSGGTMRFLVDEPAWGSYSIGNWNKDDWFTDNAGFALTLKSGSSIVYDNNGLEDSSYGDYYDQDGSHGDHGLYRGYSMSNNYDWIYASYFKLESETTFDTIIGYFDANGGSADPVAFDPFSSQIAYDMNIWSAYQDIPGTNPDSWMPAVTSFTGDQFAALTTSGTFAVTDTGVDRIFTGDVHDDIYRLTYTLDTPITLGPGVYFFSHDAEVIPEPASLGLIALGGALLLKRRKH